MKKVRDTIKLCFGRYKDDTQAVFERKRVSNSSDAQIKKIEENIT